ncbi:MAG: Na+/H+ antiporter NhaA [Massilia sp.]|nr:Na+/H+ antiporter NhaA [Massilia sp.]
MRQQFPDAAIGQHRHAGQSSLWQIAIGIAAGLLIGKPLGVKLMCFIAVALGICKLPLDLRCCRLPLAPGIRETTSLTATADDDVETMDSEQQP